jgi:sensor histidine kinase YesM
LQLYNLTVHHHQHLLMRMLTLSLVIQPHDLPNTLDRCST